MKFNSPWTALSFTVVLILGTRFAFGQHITTDGRTGIVPPQILTGPAYTISAGLGTQVGGNLFHSFGSFGLTKGETATFTGPNTISNIIGRVTGSGNSSIDGTITSQINGANLYLINPKGIVFGPNASVDVKGSFHASTADYLRLSDGVRFQATQPGGSALTAAPPAAFGFMTAAPAALTVNGSSLNGSSPSVNGQTFGLVAGPISVSAGAALLVPAGTIYMTSVASIGEVSITKAAGTTVNKFGTIDIGGGSTPASLKVGDPFNFTSGGRVFVRSDRLNLDNAEIGADNFGIGQGGKISLRADSQILLSNKTNIHAIAQSNGGGANLALTTLPEGSLTVDASSATVGNLATGSAGSLTVSAGQLTMRNGGILGSSILGGGTGGPISINTQSLLIDGLQAPSVVTGLRSLTGGAGRAPDIAISAQSVTILPNGEISSNTLGSGDAGEVSLRVGGALAINGTSAAKSTGVLSVASPGASGNAGDITINSGNMSIIGGSASGALGQVSASTFSSGRGGRIRLVVDGAMLISQNGGVFANTNSDSDGAGGDIQLRAGALQIDSNGQIAAGTKGVGNAGNISIEVPGHINLDGSSGNPGILTGISTDAEPNTTGNAGSVTLSAGTLSLKNGGAISSSAGGRGAGGDVRVKAGSLTVQGGATIASSTFGPGKGGDIIVDVASDALLADPGASAQISASSRGSGDAGSITLASVNLQMKNAASISTDATTANGGNITLTIRDLMHLIDSQITTSVKGASGNGGNILIDPQLLVLQRSSIIAQAVRGHGGAIKIIADQYLASAESIVSATSQLGISGTVELVGPRVDLNGTLVVLSSELRGAAEVLRNTCAARSALPRSTLTEVGRGGLPQDPEATIPALYFAGRDPKEDAQRSATHLATQIPHHGSLRVTADCRH